MGHRYGPRGIESPPNDRTIVRLVLITIASQGNIMIQEKGKVAGNLVLQVDVPLENKGTPTAC